MFPRLSLGRLGLLTLAALTTACAAPPKPLYQWGGYPAAVYAYFKDDGANAGAQITQLEAQIQQTNAAGQAVPPGLHGHLALLYSKVGDDAASLAHLEAERKLFPESAAYIDFLLKNAARSAAKS
jgi:hypothetical protein